MPTIRITKENFDTEVLASGKPVLLDFWAPWCIPCRLFSRTIEKVAEERPDIMVGKINVEEEPELAQRFHIQGIPNLVLLKNGKIADQQVGLKMKGQVLKMLG